MRKKLFYEAPDAVVLIIRYEEAFLQGASSDHDFGGSGPGDRDEPVDQGNY